MEIVKRADQLEVGDEVVLDNGTYIQVRGVHLPGSEWNPSKKTVRVSLGSTGWHSWPAAKQVTTIQ